MRQEFSHDLADASLEVRRNAIRVVIAGTECADLLPELNAFKSDEFIRQEAIQCVFRNRSRRKLEKAGVSPAHRGGVNTHACVRTTVVDAYQRDYEVVLAKDCIASYDAEHGDQLALYGWEAGEGDD